MCAAMKRRILCIGDSNTWGYIPVRGGRFDESVRWPCRLGAKLGEKYAVIEEGMNGRTTVFEDLIEPCVAAANYIYPCLVSQFPLDLIVIMLGTNDTKERYQVCANQIARGMREVLYRVEDACRRKGAVPKVLLLSPPHITSCEGWDDFTEESIRKTWKLGEQYRLIADECGCEFLDAAPIVGDEGVGEDGVHLNAEGHRRLAETVGTYILNYN